MGGGKGFCSSAVEPLLLDLKTCLCLLHCSRQLVRGETWAGAFEIKFNDGKSHSFRMLAHKYTLNVFAKSSIAMQTQDFPPFMYVYFGCVRCVYVFRMRRLLLLGALRG